MKQTQPIKPTSSEPLSKKVVRGVIWVFALGITNHGLGFIRTIILTRLIWPEDFGHEPPWSIRLKNQTVSGKIIQISTLL